MIVFPGTPLCVREEHDDVGDLSDKLSGLMRLPPPVPPPAPPPLPAALSTYRQTSSCGEKIKTIYQE